MEGITDTFILELEALLQEQKNDDLRAQLKTVTEYTNPNYAFLFKSIKEQLHEDNKLVKGFSGVVLEGSSRSGKTWSGIDIIIFLCLFVETDCVINICRKTFEDFKTTLYDDFKRRLDDFYLPNPFHKAKEVKSFKIGRNQIRFVGSDRLGGKLGAGSDYTFFNEMIDIPEDVFKQLTMRCRKFWWGDYNPSVTVHYIFKSVITRKDVGFLRTTFRDNRHIAANELNTILISEPWQPGSYQIVNETDIYYNGKIVDEFNQPPPHPINVAQGTADEYYWKVYGLGLRGAMKGVIFTNVRYIDEFPKDLGYIYGNDFGFTADPNAFVKYSETETDIFVELKLYQTIETPEILDVFLKELGIEKSLPMICDSSDKYTGENKGTVEMVKGLNGLGWAEASKVRKKKNVVFWLLQMKRKRINIVNNGMVNFAKQERENYRWKEIKTGDNEMMSVNYPIDKFNHFWDATRYCHMMWNEDSYEINW